MGYGDVRRAPEPADVGQRRVTDRVAVPGRPQEKR